MAMAKACHSAQLDFACFCSDYLYPGIVILASCLAAKERIVPFCVDLMRGQGIIRGCSCLAAGVSAKG